MSILALVVLRAMNKKVHGLSNYDAANTRIFFKWAGLVWKDARNANFTYTMRMNLLASICTNLAFLTLLIWRGFE